MYFEKVNDDEYSRLGMMERFPSNCEWINGKTFSFFLVFLFICLVVVVLVLVVGVPQK